MAGEDSNRKKSRKEKKAERDKKDAAAGEIIEIDGRDRLYNDPFEDEETSGPNSDATKVPSDDDVLEMRSSSRKPSGTLTMSSSMTALVADAAPAQAGGHEKTQHAGKGEEQGDDLQAA